MQNPRGVPARSLQHGCTLWLQFIRRWRKFPLRWPKFPLRWPKFLPRWPKFVPRCHWIEGQEFGLA